MNTRSMILLVAAGIASLGVAPAQDPLATRLKASDPATWKPVPYQAVSPTGGVTLDDKGLFKPVMENNIGYLLNTFSVDHMLVPFRVRAGIKDPPSDGIGQMWDEALRGSCAGRFLMGAGGTLRWIEHPELRKRMNELIDGIEKCQRADGYVLAFPPDKWLREEPNYARVWFTAGLIDAGIAGNKKAFKLLRDHADWFNKCDWLPQLTTFCPNAQQGYIGSPLTYFSPVGKPEDIQVAEKYWVQDWWVKRLAARDLSAIWEYPKPNSHSYLIVSFESYFDQYRATGEKPFLDATLAAREMIIKHWQHVGGSMAICEGPPPYPPDTLYINPALHTGETCGNVFWIKFNQRFHQLYPNEETYVNEIEKSIYNVLLPNQEGAKGIRYHCRMEGQRDRGWTENSCCEIQGARLFGSLPEYIFSTAKDGLYVNLFEPSSIRWKVADQDVSLTMNSRFPYEPKVELKLGTATPVTMKLRVRVPAWAAADMPVMVNGKQITIGKPGTYAVLDRTWAAGDTVTFTLPMGFRATRYTGVDQIKVHERYALEYGPILLAAAGPLDDRLRMRIVQAPESPDTWLQPKPGEGLHFTVPGHPDCEFMPCWDLGQRTYTCYPIIEPLAIDGTTPFLDVTEVKMMTPVVGAVIRYTTDGSEPGTHSPAFSGTLKIQKTCMLRARAFVGANPQSQIAERLFQRVPAMAPTIRPKPDTQLLEMVLPPQAPGARIHYTLDGSQPTAQSPRYEQALPMPTRKTTVRACAIIPGWDPSPTVQFAVGPDVTEPWQTPDVHLSALTPLTATAGWNSVQTDKNITGKPLALCGKTYQKGMGVHARSELVYVLKPEYRRFVALTGIDDQAIADSKADASGLAAKGSVVCEVYVDDELLYRTPVLRPAQQWHIDLPLPATGLHLKLVVTDGGDDYNYDWGDWLNAGFVTTVP